VGPSSAGKTTLCDALSKRCGIRSPAYITEIARTVMREEGFTRKDVGKIEMQYAIMKAQVAADRTARSAVARREAPILLGDRSAVDPIVYTYLSSPTDGDRRANILIESSEFQQCLGQLRSSLFILLAPIPEWVEDDGVRSVDEAFATIDGFRDILNRLRIPFHEIDGSCRPLEDRVQRVMRLAGLTSKTGQISAKY